MSNSKDTHNRRRWILLLLLLLLLGGVLLQVLGAFDVTKPSTNGHRGVSPGGVTVSSCSANPGVGTLVGTGNVNVGSTTTQPGSGVSQEIVVTIRPGGPIRISPKTITMVPSSTSVTFGPVTLVDPRGNGHGWVLYAALSGINGSGTVRPSINAVSGLASEVCSPAASALGSGKFVVAEAPLGGGGGTFRAFFTVSGLPHSVVGHRVTATFSVRSVGPKA